MIYSINTLPKYILMNILDELDIEELYYMNKIINIKGNLFKKYRINLREYKWLCKQDVYTKVDWKLIHMMMRNDKHIEALRYYFKKHKNEIITSNITYIRKSIRYCCRKAQLQSIKFIYTFIEYTDNTHYHHYLNEGLNYTLYARYPINKDGQYKTIKLLLMLGASGDFYRAIKKKNILLIKLIKESYDKIIMSDYLIQDNKKFYMVTALKSRNIKIIKLLKSWNYDIFYKRTDHQYSYDSDKLLMKFILDNKYISFCEVFKLLKQWGDEHDPPYRFKYDEIIDSFKKEDVNVSIINFLIEMSLQK